MVNSKSFTLIELIVVIAIIAILAAIIAPNAFKAIEKAKVSQQIATMKAIKTAIESLYADTTHWVGDDPGPGSIVILPCANDPWHSFGPGLVKPDNLVNDDSGWTGWDGPYIERFSGKNAWGGINRIERYDAPTKDIEYYMLPECCDSPTTLNCLPPQASIELFDKIIDGNDGKDKGNFTYPISTRTHWTLIKY
ncbi:MAG: prepilin-type N-terminal cleavage/methylation domain-containing protein [Candidatus Omnitrophota bacterium]|jgi:prepilin-type N-terminal cleavage/methylation domain-containing protein